MHQACGAILLTDNFVDTSEVILSGGLLCFCHLVLKKLLFARSTSLLVFFIDTYASSPDSPSMHASFEASGAVGAFHLHPLLYRRMGLRYLVVEDC